MNNQHTPTPTLAFKASKYKIADLLSATYGNLNIKQAKKELATFLRIKDARTIDNWLSIEAGEATAINHLLIDRLLSFFGLQDECQLYTDAHNKLLDGTN
jgi:hypothetical protein